MFFIKILIVLFSAGFGNAECRNVTKLFEIGGNISVAMILNNDCEEKSKDLTYSQRTLVNSAIWVTERINFLEIIYPLKLGLSVYQVCSENDFLKTIFEFYETNDSYPLGLVTTEETSDKVKLFSNILGLKNKVIRRNQSNLVKASVEFLNVVQWKDNLTLVTTDEQVADFLYLHARRKRICLKESYIYEDTRSLTLDATGEYPLVFFGTASDINQFLDNDTHSDEKFATDEVLFVPLDGNVPNNLPEGSFILLPPHSVSGSFKANLNIFPTPPLFEIANPLINLAVETKKFLKTSCNETDHKIECLRQKTSNLMHTFPVISPSDVVRSLKIELLRPYFGYDIYKVDKNNETMRSNIFLKPFRKIFTYNLFFENITLVDETFELPFQNSSLGEDNYGDICLHPLIFRRDNKFVHKSSFVHFRTEAWIYAFLSLSLLGILFCIAILIFLLVAIFQRRILEGNPVMTLLLLFAVMLVFSSVLPFSIENTKSIRKSLCVVKSLCVTSSYAAVFSLLLSRSIVLSSAAKEIGFMSHIAGPVQSFLCLFIFGVQAALSLHTLGKCNDIFTQGYDFVYLISYNLMLLILLLCLTPLVYPSQRNYREGKYFSAAIVLIALVWCIWLPCFTILCNEWKELMICLGLVSTGGICLGSIFIPRTYLMTIAAERDKITSALPSLRNGLSAMDIYRAHPQPIYDCVNVAAINAATVARAGVTPTAPQPTLQQPDLYSCPALPEDIDFDLCDSPTGTDKVTRF